MTDKDDALIARLREIADEGRQWKLPRVEVAQELVERAADALAAMTAERDEVETEMKRAHAGWEDAILRAEKAEAALAERDKLLPREPTEAMITAGRMSLPLTHRVALTADATERLWRAMYDAAPAAPRGKGK